MVDQITKIIVFINPKWRQSKNERTLFLYIFFITLTKVMYKVVNELK